MNVHGSELKCKYLIKVNPSQVNKPAVRETEDEMRVVEEKEVARGRGVVEEEGKGWRLGRVERARALVPAVQRGGFYCRFLLAE